MVFNCNKNTDSNGVFLLGRNITALANSCLNKEIFIELWHGFSYRCSSLQIQNTNEMFFMIGNTKIPSAEKSLYSISVTETGVCISANDEKGLKTGLFALMDRIMVSDNNDIYLSCCTISENPIIENRMAHFCVFPETELWELHKFIRLCAALKYSHVILEFWGMLKYDALEHLSWKHGFLKEQVAPVIKEARDMGLEVIPMFNHWGHASAGRVMHGKHVVLDQNPSLQSYFSDDGWRWNIKKPKVRQLLKNIREELIALCGDSEYFHIGCDEPYIEMSKDDIKPFTDYINEITEDLAANGRRPIVWGDMLISRHKDFNSKNNYVTFCPDEETEKKMLDGLDKRVIIGDWQYWSNFYPIETSLVFKNAGFDVLICPWDCGREVIESSVSTARNYGLYGIMHTTWHTLSSGTPYLTATALESWGEKLGKCFHDKFFDAQCGIKTAELSRKVYFTDGDYAKSGWAKYQIGVNT